MKKRARKGKSKVFYIIHEARNDEISRNGENADPSVHARRTWIIEQLAVLLRNNSIPQSDDWILTALNVMVTYAYFNVIKKSKKSVNNAVSV